MWSTPKVLETAMSRTEAGSRPARLAAASIRDLTASMLVAMSASESEVKTRYLMYCFSISKFDAASFAFGPFGVTLPYVSNSLAASPSLPRFR